MSLVQRIAVSIYKNLRQLFNMFGRTTKFIGLSNIIAASAMFLTGVQAWTTVYTAKVQTVPDLQLLDAIDADAKPGCGDVIEGVGGDTRTICLENSGIGPARITALYGRVNDVYFELQSLDWTTIEPYLPPTVAASITFNSRIPTSLTVPAGKSIPIVRYHANHLSPTDSLHGLIEIKRFNLFMCYCSYYHDCVSLSLYREGKGKFGEGDWPNCESSNANKWLRFLTPEIKPPSHTAGK